jgi:DNA-binding MarR family transcriptional regulator
LRRNIAFSMSRVICRLDQNLRDSVLRDLDLTYAHFRVLQVLYERDGQAIGDIARAIVVRQPVVSRVINQMEKRGLAERRPDAADSRRMSVNLTALGRRVYKKAWPPAYQIIEDALGVITVAERQLLGRLLERIDRHIDRE